MAKQPYKQYLHLNAEKESVVNAVFAIIKKKFPHSSRNDVYHVISQYEKLLLTHVTRNHAAEYRWELKTIGTVFVSQIGTPKIKRGKMMKILRQERLKVTIEDLFFAG